MPGMDGVEAARRIREIGTAYAVNMPIIALTANAIAGNEEMFLRNGFQAFIPKPIDPVRLDEVIRNFVRDRKREKSTDTGKMSAEEEPEKKGDDMEQEVIPCVNGGRCLLDFRESVVGLDIAKGVERFGGEKPFMKILQSFAVNTKSLLESIRTINEGTLAGYATTVHGIKGSSRNIFALPLGDQAEALEHAAKGGDLDFALRNNPAFLETAGKLIRGIEAVLDAVAKANPRPKKDVPDAALLSRLREACDDYDTDVIEEVMEEIERYEYESDGGLVASLHESVTKMEYGAVVEKLAARDQARMG